MQIFNRETVTEKINGNDVKVEVVSKWDYDQDAPDFDYGNPEENEKEMQKFDDGVLINAVIIVRVSALGESSTSSLGGVFIRAKTANDDLNEASLIHQLKEEALLTWRAQVSEKYETLRKVFETDVVGGSKRADVSSALTDAFGNISQTRK